ncbi:PD-(D/E)XK nuclease family protein [Nanoarchaeota archaeon]
MIKHKSFKHGWFYHYRVHNLKTEELCNSRFSKLQNFLEQMFENCPDDYFSSGPRSSKLTLELDAQVHEIEGHEVSSLAMLGLSSERYRTAHSNVQVFMLEEDDKTVGVEVPIWLTNDELDDYVELFDSDEPLTGHIDVLRIEDDKIWVWDFKPNADKEKYASTQTYFYALMLSKRTGVPLKNFKCGYFDENVAYVFDPDGVKIR